jgi:hypothetical protein
VLPPRPYLVRARCYDRGKHCDANGPDNLLGSPMLVPALGLIQPKAVIGLANGEP